MTLPQNMNIPQRNEFTADGIVYVPPTACLLPAYISAHVPAYVEPTGKAVTNKSDDIGSVRPVAGNGLILFSELTP